MDDLKTTLTFLSADELSVELGVSKRTLSRWGRLRCGPPVTKIGRRALYKRTSLTTWLASVEQNYLSGAGS